MSEMFDRPAAIRHHRPLQAGYCELILDVPEIASISKPGQFVHIRIPGMNVGSLRRPFSIADAAEGGVRILYKKVGAGTELLGQLPQGALLQVMGPLGNGFPLAPEGRPVLVGGGFGVAPLGFLAKRLPVKGVLLVGGRTAQDILDVAVFTALGWEIRIATQDGSLGIKGLVTELLDQMKGEAIELFACGPDGMLKAVGERGVAMGAKAWLSLDKHMVCSVGACLACVQKLRRPDGSEWVGRVCKDGPVFEAREIVW